LRKPDRIIRMPSKRIVRKVWKGLRSWGVIVSVTPGSSRGSESSRMSVACFIRFSRVRLSPAPLRMCSSSWPITKPSTIPVLFGSPSGNHSFMNFRYSSMPGSLSQVGSLGSFSVDAVIRPTAFCRPAGSSACDCEAETDTM
jgi:hypothetical protein